MDTERDSDRQPETDSVIETTGGQAGKETESGRDGMGQSEDQEWERQRETEW